MIYIKFDIRFKFYMYFSHSFIILMASMLVLLQLFLRVL